MGETLAEVKIIGATVKVLLKLKKRQNLEHSRLHVSLLSKPVWSVYSELHFYIYF